MSKCTHEALWVEADYYLSQIKSGKSAKSLSKEKGRHPTSVYRMIGAAKAFSKEDRKPELPHWWTYSELAPLMLIDKQYTKNIISIIIHDRLTQAQVREFIQQVKVDENRRNNALTKPMPKPTPKHTPIVADLNALSGNRWKFAETLKKYKDKGMCNQALATLMSCSYQTVTNWLRVIETFPPEYQFSNIPASYYITLMRADDPLQAAKYASENNLTLAEIRKLTKEGIPAKATAALSKARFTEYIDPDAVIQMKCELEAMRHEVEAANNEIEAITEVAQKLWVTNKHIERENRTYKSLCNTYLRELQRKVAR
ncbi:hypothetical protein KO465_04455 [Candidatus Micrarchaeota archaeon]|jgi:hypothetical protein|nr:hypothetical protein [Candidatus Micrarchaeota archaeon]